MSRLLERYIAGEQTEVWRQLSEAGCEPSEAVAVAQEFARRGFHNLRLIYGRLRSIGFEFAAPVPLAEPSERDRSLILELNTRVGPLPIVWEAWMRNVGSVDFTQRDRQLYSQGEALSGLGAGRPMIVLGLDDAYKERRRLVAEGHDEPSPWVGEARPYQCFIPMGSWGTSGEPMGVHLPDPSFDPFVIDEGAGPSSFGTEIRDWLSWGGFPFWSQILRTPSAAGRYRSVPEYAALRPLLIDGLLPL